ncbi:MAG: YdcH family protein [Hyphomonadaceae bacterium]
MTDIVFDPTDIDGMLKQLEELRTRHRELDTTIEKLKEEGGDDIKVMSLKREKLRVKDRIVWLSAKITPDIIA